MQSRTPATAVYGRRGVSILVTFVSELRQHGGVEAELGTVTQGGAIPIQLLASYSATACAGCCCRTTAAPLVDVVHSWLFLLDLTKWWLLT
ncbi:hypothetical protein MTO96_034666 [Rhipicephalus appendiculatus]